MEKQNLLAGRKKRFNYPIFQILTRKVVQIFKTLIRIVDWVVSRNLPGTLKSLELIKTCQMNRFTQEFPVEITDKV